MSDSWEARMAQRHAERQCASPLERVDACEIGGPGVHGGHHEHWDNGAVVCSCGEVLGVSCYVIDPRFFGDAAEVSAAKREDDDYQAWVTCLICGRTGVCMNGLGWPPRTASSVR